MSKEMINCLKIKIKYRTNKIKRLSSELNLIDKGNFLDVERLKDEIHSNKFLNKKLSDFMSYVSKNNIDKIEKRMNFYLDKYKPVKKVFRNEASELIYKFFINFKKYFKYDFELGDKDFLLVENKKGKNYILYNKK